MTKSKKLLIIIPIALLLIALIIVGIVFATRPVGLTTRNDISVSAYHNNTSITLPVKMVKGVYSPNANYFNNSSDIQTLCDTVKDQYTIEIIGGNAIIKDKTKPKSVNAQLLNVKGIHEKFNYGLVDGGVRIGITRIMLPLYMLDGFNHLQNFEQLESVSATLHSAATWDKVIDFYTVDDYYKVDIIADNTIKVTGLRAQHPEIFTVVYNNTNRQIEFNLSTNQLN